MITAPLVMPDMITGLSLLLFVALVQVIFCTAYVAVVIFSQLR